MSQNHVIDPTYFYPAIERFSFNYDWYVVSGTEIDDLGKRKNKFDKRVIRGSLQSQGTSQNLSLPLNSESMQYRFYCKSLYRINIGDFIRYKDRWLRVNQVRDIDEYGVRSCTLQMVTLNNYHDLKEYLQYLEGQKFV